MSETYTCLVWEPSWASITLRTGRHLTDEEKVNYTAEYREKMFLSVEAVKELSHIPWQSLPQRESDGCFPGTSNTAWILSEEEKGYYLGMEAGLALAEQNAKDRAAAEAESLKKAEEQVRESDLESVQWTTTEKTIRDEGGKTTEYLHSITIRGKTYRFLERSVFDFGRVINSPDQDGMAASTYVWKDFTDGVGWRTVREMEPDEREAYRLVCKYGRFARSGVRM